MKTYSLQLTEQEAQVVLLALSEMKLKDSLSTFISIQNQITELQTKEVKEKK